MYVFLPTKTAQDFPLPILAHGQVKYEQTFLVFGGQTTGKELLDTLYLYNNINGTWSVMQTRLDEKQSAVSATWVDAAKFPSRSATANSNKECLIEVGVMYQVDKFPEKKGVTSMEECRTHCTQYAPYFAWNKYYKICKCRPQCKIRRRWLGYEVISGATLQDCKTSCPNPTYWPDMP